MELNFLAPSTRRPRGGVSMIYEVASSMAERGHTVHLHHLPILHATASGPDDIHWHSFRSSRLTHHFPAQEVIDSDTFPAADFVFWFDPVKVPPHAGLPLVLVQGYNMLRKEFEDGAYRAPCPKICVSSWLVDVGRELGVPERQLVHLPLGLTHDKYRLHLPIADRPPRVSYCCSVHPQKHAGLAMKVLSRAKEILPELEAVVFGTEPPTFEWPSWITYRTNPPQEVLVEEIYNNSRVFLCTSNIEGFGLCSIEAMACGAALVTTDNGGSREFAVHGETGLIAPPGDADTLVDHVVSLLRDDGRRIDIAAAGREYVERFEWDRTGALLESFLEQYRADPAAYGRPSEIALGGDR